MAEAPDRADAARIKAFMDAHNTITLATSVGDKPWAATMFFVSDGALNVFFVSDQRTTHIRHADENPQVALTINADIDRWADVAGLQIAGRIELVEGMARAKALTLYLRKFAEISALFEKPANKHEATIAERLKNSNFYCVRPEYIRFIDNSQGFGHRDEWVLSDAG